MLEIGDKQVFSNDGTVELQRENQLQYPIDINSKGIVERLISTFKWSRKNMKNVVRIVNMEAFAFDVAVTVGDGKQYTTITEELDGCQVIAAEAFLLTAKSASGGPILIQIHNITDSVDILSTRINIDDGDWNSYDATTRPVITFANAQLAKGDRLRVDVDDAGDGAAKGLQIALTVQ